MFKHSHVGSCCAPGPCPGSRLPSPNEGTCQPGQRPRPPARWGMLRTRWEVGVPPGPSGHHKLQQEPPGLVAPPCPLLCHLCSLPASLPWSKMRNIDIFLVCPPESVSQHLHPCHLQRAEQFRQVCAGDGTSALFFVILKHHPE